MQDACPFRAAGALPKCNGMDPRVCAASLRSLLRPRMMKRRATAHQLSGKGANLSQIDKSSKAGVPKIQLRGIISSRGAKKFLDSDFVMSRSVPKKRSNCAVYFNLLG